MTHEEQDYKLPEKPIDYSPQAIAERAVKEVEPYFENALKEHNMKREEQDKVLQALKYFRTHATTIQKEIAIKQLEKDCQTDVTIEDYIYRTGKNDISNSI